MRFDELELSAPTAIVLTRVAPASCSASPSPRRSVSLSATGFPVALALILALGVSLRLLLPAGFNRVGFDENLYRIYVAGLDEVGLRHYPMLIDRFVAHQIYPPHLALVPPTRIVYIASGYLCHRLLGVAPLTALHGLSCFFSSLTLLVSAVFSWRLTKQRALTIAVTALVACAATQIHLAQHALIDGVFGFWALLVVWLLWENLKQPNTLRWEIAYGLALTAMVMTKESAFFIVVVIVGILASNHWLNFGNVTRRLLVTTFIGALAGITIVVVAAGGVEQFSLVFSILAQEVPILSYTIKTGGGPWHRYLVDLVLVSPTIVLLASANILQSRRKTSDSGRYIMAFCCFVYAALTAFSVCMNLRYILMLDMPLRFLAATQLFELSEKRGRYRNAILVCAIAAICGHDLWQHHVLFVKGGLYELVTDGLVRAQGIVR